MTVMPALRTLRLPCLLVLVWGLLACAANPALEESRQAFATRSPELALRELLELPENAHRIADRNLDAPLGWSELSHLTVSDNRGA